METPRLSRAERNEVSPVDTPTGWVVREPPTPPSLVLVGCSCWAFLREASDGKVHKNNVMETCISKPQIFSEHLSVFAPDCVERNGTSGRKNSQPLHLTVSSASANGV